MLTTLLFGGSVLIQGNTIESYYYNAIADVAPTGSGKVYVSNTQATGEINYQASSTTGTQTAAGQQNSYAEVTLYFYAQNNPGYGFEGWYNGSTLLSTNPNYTATNLQAESTSQRYPTQFTYTAHFKELEATVFGVSTNTARGTVVVTPENNYEGVEVTLVALPDASSGVKFLGWKTSNSESAEYVSTKNPLVVTATSSAVTYYAFFTEPASMVYCILENVSTGRVLSVYGDGAATNHQRRFSVSGSSRTANDGYVFTNGLKMLSKDQAMGNPLTVFKRTSTAMGGSVEEGTLATDIPVQSGSMSTNISFSVLMNKEHELTFDQLKNGNYNIYIKDFPITVEGETLNLNTYLRDPGTGDTPTMETTYQLSGVTGTEWKVYFLTEEQQEGAFGAYARSRFTQDGAYYTSLYAPFAYKLLDGVKAFYFVLDEDSYIADGRKVRLKEIPTGSIVPANTAVVLECQTADDPTKNRLLPVDASEADASLITTLLGNQLRGNTNIYSKQESKLLTIPNGNLNFVFGIDGDVLGFYRYNGDYMPSGKAYVVLPCSIEELEAKLQDSGLAKNLRLVFGSSDDGPSGIISNRVAEVADDNYYDLQGRQVATPGKGVYIHKGKKIVKP